MVSNYASGGLKPGNLRCVNYTLVRGKLGIMPGAAPWRLVDPGGGDTDLIGKLIHASPLLP